MNFRSNIQSIHYYPFHTVSYGTWRIREEYTGKFIDGKYSLYTIGCTHISSMIYIYLYYKKANYKRRLLYREILDYMNSSIPKHSLEIIFGLFSLIEGYCKDEI